MKRFIGTRILIALLSVSLVVTMMPQIAFAAPENTASEKTVQQEDAAPEEGEAAEMDLEHPAEAEQEEAEAAEQDSGNVEQTREAAFSQTETIDGVMITVEAEQGVFPADAFLQAEKVTKKEQKKVDAAVEEALDKDRKIGLSYSFDIKVLDPAGNELQPADEDKVSVSFKLDRVKDPNLNAEVYHITETDEGGLTAEKLDADTDEKAGTVTAETEGFSSYTVTFTYDGNLNYEFQPQVDTGDYSRPLNEIVRSIGLSGEIQNAVVSDDRYVVLSRDQNRNWIVTVKDFFYNEQTITVTIDEVDYDIRVKTVFDETQADYIDENGAYNVCYEYHLFTGASDLMNDGWWVIDKRTNDSHQRVSIEGDVHLIVTNDAQVVFKEGIQIQNGSSLTIYGQSGQKGKIVAKGIEDRAGIGVPWNATLTVNGAIVNGVGGDDGAGIGGNSGRDCGTIIINDGKVTGDGSHQGAGIGGGAGGGKISRSITINGGTVRGNGLRDPKSDEEFTGAGIGAGSGGSQGGPITINGGNVQAYARYGAGIGGGGMHGQDGGKVIINDGTVSAISVYGAGIGGGGERYCQDYRETTGDGGDVKITGGEVFAASTSGGAGIGGGCDSKLHVKGGRGGKLEVTGGTVSAVSAAVDYDWLDDVQVGGFGNATADFISAVVKVLVKFFFSDYTTEKVYAAAIGGAYFADGGDVKITGGIVFANSGEGGKAIGHGTGANNDGALEIGQGMIVKAGPDYNRRQRVATDLRAPACRGNAFAEIRRGPLRVNFDVSPADCEAPASQEVDIFNCVTRPGDPVCEGWIFDGWCTDQARTKLYDFDKQYTGSGDLDMTLYARWIKKCDLKVTKEWPSREHPDSIDISYNHTSRGMESQDDTLTLSEDDSWSGSITISNQGVLTLEEGDCEGFFNDGWEITVEGGSVSLPVDKTGKAALNLKNQESSGLSKEDYNKVKAAVETGSAELRVVNKKAKVFSVEKVWDIGASNGYKPDELKVVLQKKQNDSWIAIETVRLTQDNAVEDNDNKWRAEFKPVEDKGENDDSLYRIRELDQNGRIVYAKTDTDGPGEDPNVTFRVEPETDRELNVRYDVTYDTAENGLTTITNKAGTVYKVKINWTGVKPEARPESVKVSMYRKDAEGELHPVNQHPSVTVSQKSGWKGSISIIADGEDEKNYVLREEWYDGQTTAYDGDDIVPSYVFENAQKKAQYKVKEDGKTKLYSYDVSYEVQTDDDGIKTTEITNEKSGIIFNVQKKWNVPEDSAWPRRIYAVYAVVQHRTVDQQGNVKWELIDDSTPPSGRYWKRLSISEQNWTGRFNVPLDDDYDAGDYRVREVICNQDPEPTGMYQNRTYVTDTDGIDTESFAYTQSGNPVPAKVMLAADDEDNARRAAPVFYSAQYTGENQDPERTSFTVSYDIDENGTYIISNRQSGYISVEKKWVDEDGKALDKWKPESVKVVLQKKNGENWENQDDPVELKEENNWKHLFNVSFSEADRDNYRVRELDKKNKPVEDGGDVTHTIKYNDEDTDVAYSVKYEPADETGNYVIENKINAVELEIEKKWEIDLEKKDRPESIGVIIQEKTKTDEGKEKWEKAEIVKLDNDGEWKTTALLPKTRRKDNGEREEIEYRMRELRQEGAIAELLNGFKDKIDKGKDGYTEWIGQFKESEYFGYLPEDVRNAANEGYDSLLDKLNTTEDKLYDKLMEELNVAYKPEQRIVYDKDDQEYKDLSDEDKKDKNKEANRVSFYVKSYESAVSGGTESGHTTRYMVTYETENDGRKMTITNKAILEITEIKRWLKLGAEDKDLPDSVWLVLMFRLNPEAMEKAGDFGVDASGLQELELPAFSGIPLLPDILLEGGGDPISIISKLALGVDLNIFEKIGIELPKMAIEKVEKPKKDKEDEDKDKDKEDDKGWRTNFVVTKYALGIPVEYKGAELGSEVIRQIIKYMTNFDIPISYNPLQNFISIPTKAIPTIAGITDPGDLIDFSKLSGIAKEKAQNITMDEINDFGWGSILDMWRLMANVINIKIDSDDESIIEVTKTWKNDKEEDRPDTLTIHIKDKEGNEIDGAPIELKKEDFKGRNTWSYLLDLSKNEDQENPDNSSGADGDYEITEEYPEGYEHKDDYTLETSGFDLTNTWHEEEVQTVDVSGRKTWKDSNDHDGKRPDKITVRLKADGEEVAHAETSKAAGWKWNFTNLPKFKEGSDSEKIKYTIEEDAVDGYEAEVKGYNITNTHEIETVDIEGEKTWNDGNDQDGKRPASITIVLSADGEEVARKNVSASDDWKWKFKKLPKYDNGSRIYYSISEEKVKGYETDVDDYDVTNSYEPETVDIDGRKTWKDSNDQDGKRPASITIRLKADGEEVDSVTVSEADDWKWEFNGLPKNKRGKRITYTITEDTVDDYTTSVNGYDVTNSYTPGKTQVNVQKKWQDNDDQDGIRPSHVVVKLLADGEDTGKSLTLSAGNNWSGSFTGIDQKKDGAEIAYTVEEQTTDVITGEDAAGTYASEVEGDAQAGFTITNTHTPETVDINGKKTWKDSNNQEGERPDNITIRLKADGEEVKSATVSESDDWKWEFNDLPKNKNGKRITYTITEDAVDNYTTSVNGYDVTNSYNPGKTQVNVQKKWQDNDDQDGIRPQSVSVKLLADGEDTGKTVELNENNHWTAAFEGLDAKRDGSKIEYSVEEVKTDAITGDDGKDSYAIKVEGDAASGFTITNTHTPRKISINVTKVWDDADDQDGIRPSSVTMQLREFDQGVWFVRKTITLDESNNWSGAFTDVDKNGRYSVMEKATTVINGNDWDGSYSFRIVGSQEKGYVVTNTHTPVVTERSVYKKWDDSDNADGIRPAALEVTLRETTEESGEKDVRTVTLNEDNNWKATVKDLPIYRKGEKIEYSWTEEAPENYQLTSTDVSGKTTTFTNKHEPAKTSIKVTKKWVDNDDSDGFRPDSVAVRLLADGKDTGKRLSLSEQDQTEENEWEDSFTDLQANKAGRKIVYTVDEIRTDVITGTDGAKTYKYEVTGNAEEGFTITNTHTPQTCSRTIKKVWNDDNDVAHERPETLAVTLYGWISGDGTGSDIEPDTVTTLTLNADDQWTATKDGLPVYRDGRKINYYWEEEDVPEYGLTNVSQNGETTTFTNSRAQDTLDLSCGIEWDDQDNNDGIRPKSIVMVLNAEAGGKKTTVQSASLSEQDGWKTVEVKGQPVYDGDGNKITYTWEPDPKDTEGYGHYSYTSGTHTQFIYWHYPANESIEVCKIWDDADDQDGVRPDGITVNLYEGSTVKDTVVLTADNAREVSGIEGEVWYWNWEYLLKYKDGEPLTYSIEEETVDGYTTSMPEEPETIGDEMYRYTITNAHTPATRNIDVTKKWADNDDSDGFRPDSVTVKLLADGEDTGKKLILSEKSQWTGTFKELNVNRNGKMIDYTVEETRTDVITGTDGEKTYADEVTGDAESGFTITNTHTPVLVDKTVEKLWDDDDDNDGMRPSSLKVTLYETSSESREEVETITLKKTKDWTATIRDLPKYRDGAKINYIWDEEETIGYLQTDTVVDGDTTTLINTHAALETNVSAGIEWDDSDNYDRIRPKEMQFDLYAEYEDSETGEKKSEKVEDRSVHLEEEGWETVKQEGLPAFRDGAQIKYIWKPASTVKSYGTYSYTSGTHTQFVYWHYPNRVDVEVCKIWNDRENADGTRPESIRIDLYEVDGEQREQIDTVELTAENAAILKEDGSIAFPDEEDAEGKEIWYWTWDLPKTRDGAELSYAAEEEPVEGYTSAVEDMTAIEGQENLYRYKITNTENITIEGSKNWDDEGDKAGKRPSYIMIRLFADEWEVGSRIVTEPDNWAWRFTDLPANREDGEAINYTIKEDRVDGYTTAVNGFNVTNKYRATEPDPDSDGKQHTITYDLNGGSYDGSTSDIVEKHNKGAVISIHAAPVREGYTFTYWKGSAYHPGDSYTVTEDHTFVAQWIKNTGPKDPDRHGTGANTGDDMHLGFWIAMLLMSLTALVSVAVLYRRRRREY